MRLIVAALLCATTAHAQPKAEIYSAKSSLVVRLDDDDKNTLAVLVGKDKKAPVRCFAPADKAALVGCYVGVKRDGTLIAPELAVTQLAPPLDGELTTRPIADALELTISGSAGNAIGLWVDCADKRGVLRCKPNQAAGKLGWDVRFVVLKGGNVRAAADNP